MLRLALRSGEQNHHAFSDEIRVFVLRAFGPLRRSYALRLASR